MATTGYSLLKHHFDKLILGGYPRYFYGNGLEPIRDTYEKAFNRKINLLDVYQTDLRISNNPINKIITLVGPESDEPVPDGIMTSGNDIVSVNIFSDNIFKGISPSEVSGYVVSVYSAMQNIVMMDRFFAPDSVARKNPYMTFIKACPFYFTYHHAKECIPEALNGPLFHNLLEKYIIANDDTDKVLESISSTKYSANVEDIYYTITCKNTVELIW